MVASTNQSPGSRVPNPSGYQSSFRRSLVSIHVNAGVTSDRTKRSRRHSNVTCITEDTHSVIDRFKRSHTAPELDKTLQTSSRKIIVKSPLPPLPFNPESRLSAPENERVSSLQVVKKKNVSDSMPKAAAPHCGFRKDYTLGDQARSLSHLNNDTDCITSLKAYDFAFVKRGDGSWTYAILATRSQDQDATDEGHMLFVLNDQGSTKCIKRQHWNDHIRCVEVEVTSRSSRRTDNAAATVPRSISISRTFQDECSVISFDSIFYRKKSNQ